MQGDIYDEMIPFNLSEELIEKHLLFNMKNFPFQIINANVRVFAPDAFSRVVED